jgi:hypothetical protein
MHRSQGWGLFLFYNLVSVRTIISGVLVAIMCFRSCWLVKTPLTLRAEIFNEERYLVSVWLDSVKASSD